MPVTYFMKVIKVAFTFDEKIFPDAWRINSQDCKISDDEKRSIVFFHPDQSLELWKNHVSSKSLHLMKILADDIQVSSKLKLDFSLEDEGRNFFLKELKRYSLVVFFWGARSACLVRKNILVNHWTDFFYPSDESSVIFIPNSGKKIFSYEEVFFVGRIKNV